MSAADLAPAPMRPGGVLAARRGIVRPWLRMLRSELGLMFRRWRNRALLAVVVAIPVLLGSALRVAVPAQGGQGGGGNGPAAAFLTQVAGNGVFLSFLALTIMLTIMLPLVVAVVSGESLAGEANTGTLRYLLVVPAGRARLLSVKYVAVVLFALVACLAAIMILAISSEVADNIPQFAAIGPYLPSHWWLAFDTELTHGLFSFAVYIVIFGSITWARFTSADITS
jgi:ABC-type Na+ efflux pump permease subunit